MNIYHILPLASFSLNLFLAGYIAASGKHNRAGKAFIIYAVTIALWSLSELLLGTVQSREAARIVLRVSSMFILSSSFLFLNFVYSFSGRKRDIPFFIFAAIALVCIAASIMGDAYHGQQIVRHSFGYTSSRGRITTIIDLATLAPAMYALHIILQNYLSTTSHQIRRQYFFVLTGFGITFAATVAWSLILPMFISVSSVPAAPSSLGVIFIAFIFHSISRYRFLADSIEMVAHHIFSRMKESVVVLDRNHQIVAANESARRLLGISEEKYSRIEDLLPPPYRFDEDCNDLAVTTHIGGTPKDLLVTQMTLIEGEEPAGRLIIVNDITAQKQAANALKETQEKFSSAFNASPIPLAINHIATGRYLDVNDAMVRISGYRREDFIGRTPAGLGVFEDRDDLIAFVKLLAKNRRVSGFECRLRRRDGVTAECSISAEPVTIGGEEYIITATIDISEQKKAARKIQEQYEEIQAQYNVLEVMNEELARTHREVMEMNRVLAREKERLSATLKAIGEGVITTDAEGRIEIINPIGERITGYGSAAAVGRHVEDVLPLVNERTGMTCGDMVKKVLSSGSIVEMRINTIMTTEEGITRHISAIGAPIRYEDRIEGVIVVFRDISERVRMEMELMNSSKIESLALFAGGIAHDFNNLLTSITGNVSLARLTLREDDPFQSVLTDIEIATKRAKDLTLQLLTFSKGGAPIKQAISVPALLHDTAEFVLSGSNIKCTFDIADDLRYADIDEGQISQVIQNLILNASQAMPEGGTITIVARNLTSEEASSLDLHPNKYIHISVSDQGTGIDEKHLSRIFDPFFTTKEHGTGLGLAVSYSIIKRHGGHITVRSRPGEGTTFDIYLPATDEKPAEKVLEPRVAPHAAGRALLMDDEDLVRSTGERMLRHMGFIVETAKNGEEAVRRYREAMDAGRTYDVVIMDLTVRGGMGGKEAIGMIREIDPNVNAVVSSGYSNDPVMADFRSHGFKGVVTKPYRYEDLAQVLHSLMNQASNAEM